MSSGLMFCVVVFLFCCLLIAVPANNVRNGEVDDGEREDDDDEADTGIEDSFFGFFEFAGIPGRCHVVDATNDDIYDGNESAD